MASTAPKIVLTGATGNYGSIVLSELLKSIPASEIGISANNPDKATNLSKEHRILKATYDDQASLEKAFQGAEKVLLVSSNSQKPGEAFQHHKNLINAAKAANVKTVYYTSHHNASKNSAFPPSRHHKETEEYLAGSGLGYVIIRSGFYQDVLPLQLKGVDLNTNTLYIPKDGKTCWTAREDIANVAAKLILEEKSENRIVTLASLEALDMEDVVGIYNEVNGKDVKLKFVSPEDYKKGAMSHGVPEHTANMLTGIFEAAKGGEFWNEDKTLTELSNGPLITVREMFEKMKSA